MVAEGQEAPDFTLPDQDGNEVTLSEPARAAGRPLLLPKADTPGCTAQACGVRDHRSDYEGSGARVVGVSPDTVAAQRKFADKYGLDFTLLADEDHAVAELYGVWGEKKMYGKTYMGVQPCDLPDRSRRQGRQGLPEGLAEDARRGRARGARRARFASLTSTRVEAVPSPA